MKIAKIRMKALSFALATSLLAAPAAAGWRKIEPVSTAVINGAFTVKPGDAWNRASGRPAKWGETWTKDGFQLNRLDFFGPVAAGQSIYKERSKKHRPMPKFRSDMLMPDLAELFEANFSIEQNVTAFEVMALQPAKLGGHDGLELTYSYALPEDRLLRRGVARMAIAGGKLYLVNFTAPGLYYFEKDAAEVRSMMDHAVLE